jgi:hypothetical protein
MEHGDEIVVVPDDDGHDAKKPKVSLEEESTDVQLIKTAVDTPARQELAPEIFANQTFRPAEGTFVVSTSYFWAYDSVVDMSNYVSTETESFYAEVPLLLSTLLAKYGRPTTEQELRQVLAEHYIHALAVPNLIFSPNNRANFRELLSHMAFNDQAFQDWLDMSLAMGILVQEPLQSYANTKKAPKTPLNATDLVTLVKLMGRNCVVLDGSVDRNVCAIHWCATNKEFWGFAKGRNSQFCLDFSVVL